MAKQRQPQKPKPPICNHHKVFTAGCTQCCPPAPPAQFEPAYGKVLDLLARQARGAAEALGHQWNGLAEFDRTRGLWSADCPRCFSWVIVAPRVWNKASISGEMVSIRCKAA